MCPDAYTGTRFIGLAEWSYDRDAIYALVIVSALLILLLPRNLFRNVLQWDRGYPQCNPHVFYIACRAVILVLGLDAQGLAHATRPSVARLPPRSHCCSPYFCLSTSRLHSPPYTMIFSKMLPQRVRILSARSMAALRPRFGRATRPVKDIVRKSPVGLENAAFAMQMAGQLGSSVPYLQGVMEATAKILERIEAVKRNHKDCKELGEHAQSIIDMMWSTTEKMAEEDLDDLLRLHLAELETALLGIITAMHDLRKQSKFQRILRKQHNDAALSEHKEKLKNAFLAFQFKELIVTHCYQARAVRLSDDGKRAHSSGRRILAEGDGNQDADRALLMLYWITSARAAFFF
ncbi:hypothetical protein C8Q74DRAFT_1441667 [Fomes fomentarius]|nr:hypothetical protein C8Q74DRAFT_1441667 [Fomes fomentarius]